MRQRLARGFQDSHHLLARHALKGVEKIRHAHAVLQILEKRIHRHARIAKANPSAQTFGIAPGEWFGRHGVKLARGGGGGKFPRAFVKAQKARKLFPPQAKHFGRSTFAGGSTPQVLNEAAFNSRFLLKHARAGGSELRLRVAPAGDGDRLLRERRQRSASPRDNARVHFPAPLPGRMNFAGRVPGVSLRFTLG